MVHFLLPIVVLIVMFAHLYLIHCSISYEEFVVVQSKLELISFYKAILFKDLLLLCLLFWICMFLVLSYSVVTIHPDSYLYANTVSTPFLIEPE